jgi:three-Cys-motif partner protein
LLDFIGDAISLSGLTGTKLKCEVIGAYYPFWWKITSGGQARSYSNPTAIVELNAATGEVYIKETNEIVLGSAGHALELKASMAPHTRNFSVVLVEEDPQCYAHLKSVIGRRWPSICINENPTIDSKVYLFNADLDAGLSAIQNLPLRNSIFFFDPLRSVPWSAIEKVAMKRLSRAMYPTGTEFLVFLFTSDWFRGRDDFAPLPKNSSERRWKAEEADSVRQGDMLFGNRDWRRMILVDTTTEIREQLFVDAYKKRLQRWFRYVLPLPFQPKPGQLFHLILCSNFEVGVRMTRDHYAILTGNVRYAPDNDKAYAQFAHLHPETLQHLTTMKQRPVEWRVLWSIIKQNEDGRCDNGCPDLLKIQPAMFLQQTLDWLATKGYLKPFVQEIPWKTEDSAKSYELNWDAVKSQLGIEPPAVLVPMTAEMQIGAGGQRKQQSLQSKLTW